MKAPDRRRSRLAVAVLGIVLGQLTLYAPSLLGIKILLPLDLLALPNTYLPPNARDSLGTVGPESTTGGVGARDDLEVSPGNPAFTDLIFAYEMNRRFVAAELRAGRVPMWAPDGYTGAPFANFPKYSPFLWPYYLFDSPLTLAWIQVLTALVAGVGAYAFFRIALRLSFWPSALVAWCVPLGGFFILWQGFALIYDVALFPWMLLAVDRTVRAPRYGMALAGVTLLTLISGQIDLAGLVLLASGVYALGMLLVLRKQRLAARVGALIGGWGIGFLLAAPYLIPLVEYTRTGSRLISRIGGSEERPPIGLSALPQMFDPNFLGSARRGSIYFGLDNHMESPAAGYAGVLLTLVLAPLAWRSARHRPGVVLFSILLLLAVSWDLALPGLVDLWRTPWLRYFSYNRFVFVSSFAIAALAAIGLESLFARRTASWRLVLVPALAAGALGALALSRAFDPPSMLPRVMEALPASGAPGRHLVDTPAEVESILRAFRLDSLRQTAICLLAIASLASLLRGWKAAPFAIVGLAWIELLTFGFGYSPQSDRRLYFPAIPTLEQAPTSDRVLGFNCLPPNLHRRFGFRDVRGYDGVDPAPIVDLLDLCRDPKVPVLAYARAQYFVPVVMLRRDGSAGVSPLMSLANVRYLVFRGSPPEGAVPVARGDDYWILENRQA